MLVNRIGELAMIAIGAQAVVDKLAISRILFKLRRTVPDVANAPEGIHAVARLLHDFALFKIFGEHHIP